MLVVSGSVLQLYRPLFVFSEFLKPVIRLFHGKGGEKMLKEKKEGLREFGQGIYKLRKSKHLSQLQLANLLDVDRRQISRYETGEAEMGAMLYAKMQEALSVKIDPQLENLLQQWDTLTQDNKNMLLDLATTMNRAQERR